MQPLEFLNWSGRIGCFSPPANIVSSSSATGFLYLRKVWVPRQFAHFCNLLNRRWHGVAKTRLELALVVLISLCSQPGFIHAQTNSRVIAWGLNYSNQTNVPPGLTNLTAIAGGGSHSMAIESDGTVIAWGNNSYRQCYVPWYVNYYKARARPSSRPPPPTRC